MQPLKQSTIAYILRRVLFKIALVVTVTLLTFYVSTLLNPVTVSNTLSPNGVGQSGWPLPFAASFWDYSVTNPYQAQRFNTVFFLLDVAVMYLAMMLLMYLGKLVLQSIVQDEKLNAWIGYGQWTFLIVGAGVLIYYAANLYATQVRLDTDVPSAEAPAPSALVRVTDAAELYSINLPRTWSIFHEGAAGVRLSQIIAQSPDWRARSDETVDGPFTPVYYESGATIQFHVSTERRTPPYHGESDTPQSGVTETRTVSIDGVEGVYHVFKWPSTAEGQLLDVHLNNNGNEYSFHFGYNPATYPQGEQMFNEILRSVRFAN